MRRPSVRTSRPAIGASFAAILAIALAAQAAAAADPSASPPTADPSATAPTLRIEAWLDEPLPNDAEPGTSLRIGALLWDPLRGMPTGAPASFVRLYPATGDGPPVESPATQDWPGHVVATVAVPPGSVGHLEIGVQGSSCGPDGCRRSDALYDLRGVGPPDGARLPQIAEVDIEPLLPAWPVGEAATVDVVLRPDVAWPDVAPPDRLVLQVREPRGDTLAEMPAELVDAATGRYEASVTLPGEGGFVLRAATVEDAPPDETFTESTVPVTALAADPSPSPEPSGTGAANGSGDAGRGDGTVVLLGVIAGLAVLVAAGVVYLGVRER